MTTYSTIKDGEFKMVKTLRIIKATRASRKRDNGRMILCIGDKKFHLTKKEVKNLKKRIG